MSLLCYRCDSEIPESGLGRQDVCASCGWDVRVCKNCRHYDKNSNNECREEQAGRQVEKEKANFCEWFQPRSGGVQGAGPQKDSAKQAAEALFGGKSKAPSSPDSAKAAAEALFKKKS